MRKAKKAKAGANVEAEGAAGKKKKGGKKKLLMVPVVLVLVAAVAAAAVLFILPRFGIDLLHKELSPEEQLEEPIPKKGVETYTVGEDTVPSLDTVLVEGDGELIALRSPGKSKGDSSTGVDDRFTYIYELNSFADIMNRYLDVLMGSEQGFYITDETYLVQEERPELQDTEGVLILARNATVPEGTEAETSRVFQLVIGWSQASANLAVRVSTAEGKISFPKKETEQQPDMSQPSSVSMQMDQLRSMSPAHLGLPGDSMDEYTIFPVDGFVKVDGMDCRRFNVYESSNPGSIAGVYLFSVEGDHVYVLDPNTNTVSTIR